MRERESVRVVSRNTPAPPSRACGRLPYSRRAGAVVDRGELDSSRSQAAAGLRSRWTIGSSGGEDASALARTWPVCTSNDPRPRVSPHREARGDGVRERSGRRTRGASKSFYRPSDRRGSGNTRSRNMRSRCRCSMCPAIHINSRSWLRSSSTHEPSDPPRRVISSPETLVSWSPRGRATTGRGFPPSVARRSRTSARRASRSGALRSTIDRTFC